MDIRTIVTPEDKVGRINAFKNDKLPNSDYSPLKTLEAIIPLIYKDIRHLLSTDNQKICDELLGKLNPILLERKTWREEINQLESEIASGE